MQEVATPLLDYNPIESLSPSPYEFDMGRDNEPPDINNDEYDDRTYISISTINSDLDFDREPITNHIEYIEGTGTIDRTDNVLWCHMNESGGSVGLNNYIIFGGLGRDPTVISPNNTLDSTVSRAFIMPATMKPNRNMIP